MGMLLLGVGKPPSAGSGSTLLVGLVAFWKLADTADSAGGNTLTNN